MKHSLTCPKCQHRKIWHVAELRESAADTGGLTALPVATVTKSVLGMTHTRRLPATFEVFACQRCGYAELYAKGQLAEVPGQVTLLDNEPKATLR